MSLAGKWKKVSSSKCDEAYPDQLEFFERPRYLGKKGERQSFIWWDVGSYEVIGKNLIRMSTASDEQVLYEYSLSENELRFKDSNGCEFEYQRLKE